ncbi:MAG: aminotransferase class I/II-fold pyridoxal phosphate-dependent enzyme [Oscillospiraceae bacterium]|jgi:threonine-phosphate decarboxylase|nr:aminotransferase class I/II-fold pyridoxal phosphate-dependent enzyme [Oscillospiraceae bacterium]MCI9548759.1 aminotransferase class I/II-fold pyridoxal phosphate-dependent enzyme [Oscillospiraceae bacterium]
MEAKLTHGGDWAGYQAERGGQPLDFSANISPLGLPEGVRRAAVRALDTAERYPDPLCRALRAAIGKAEGVDPAWVLCGNGAAELIYRAVLARRPKRGLVTAPAFSEYEAALELAGCSTDRFLLKEGDGFALNEDFLEAITPDMDLVFLCQPNNPTGRTVPRALLAAAAERCRAAGALLVLDECFCGFLDDPDAFSLKDLVGRYENLLILKAFTKLYAMAGLRLGYCLCSDAALLAAMGGAGQPWGVSGPAQAAGIAALEETNYVEAVRAQIQAQRPRLAGELSRLGLRVVPGEANYLLFWSPVPLVGPLRERGILLRDCANYHGLCEGWYRTAVRTAEENSRLLAALEEILREGSL